MRRGGRVDVLLGEAAVRRGLAAGEGRRRRGGVAPMLGEERPHCRGAQTECVGEEIGRAHV